MDTVEDKVFYHIDRSNSLKVGDTVFYGKEKNRFNLFFDKYGKVFHGSDGSSIDVHYLGCTMADYVQKGLKNEHLEKVFNYDKDSTIVALNSALSHYLKFTRETLFEEVRRDFFPHLPSRLQCLWIIPETKEAVRYWWTILGQNGRILKLNVSGKVHQSSQSYLQLNTNNFDFIREQAFKYWSSHSVNNPVENECLFEGFIKVTEEISIEEFK